MAEGRQIRYWSHAKVSAGRWRWFVAGSHSDFRAGRFTATGDAPSASEAVAQAEEAASADGAQAVRLSTSWALQQIAATRKATQPKPARTRRELERRRQRERDERRAASEAAAGAEILAGRNWTALSRAEQARVREQLRQRSHELAKELEQQTSQIPRFAVGTVGKGRWFWAVVANPDAFPRERLGSGYALTRDEAVAAARQVAGDQGIEMEPAALRLRHLHEELARARRRERAGHVRGCTTRTGTAETILMGEQPVEVVKRTGRFVYVLRPSWRAAHPGQMWRLDRERLERDGELRHDGLWFMTVEHAAQLRASGDAGRRRPGPIMALGLELPCSEQDVHRAYRRLAMNLHPDHGGDADEFMRLHACYKAALDLQAQSGSAVATRDKRAR